MTGKTSAVRALDLFAGTGWGVACQRLGIEEMGVEIMPEAVAVREHNGMQTIYNDVWEGLTASEGERARIYRERARDVDSLLIAGVPVDEVYNPLIASPPCQTFSMAGNGAGRKALDDVLAAIDAGMHLRPESLRELGDRLDPKTALVLAPLAHVARDTPTYVVFEQVPPVLPVWERCAIEMRKWGYSVWTGNLQAEQYGVPQTRKRAILIARADGGEAKAPTPTHSRYYSRDPQRLDEGVLPWVSMFEALNWGMTERPMVTAGNAIGRAEGYGDSGGKASIWREKARGAWAEKLRTNQGNPRDGYYERDTDKPSPTVTGVGSRSWNRIERGDATQVRTGMGKGMIERHGDRPPRDVLDPAFTVLGGAGGNSQPGFGIQAMRSNYSAGGEGTADERGRTPRPESAPPLTITSKGAQWQEECPATTVMGAPTIWPPGHKVNGDDIRRLGADAARERYGDRAGTHATRVTVSEAAALQSYPADFKWDATILDPRTGREKPITKTSQFLQVGNAVPPLLAEAILREVLS